MSIDFELFENKSYNDLLKDIVSNTEDKRNQIDIVISDLRNLIKTVNDAIILAPIIQSYLDTSVKNDDQLVKLAAVIQRLISSQTNSEEGGGFALTDVEKDQLLKDIKNIQFDTSNPVEIAKIEKK